MACEVALLRCGLHCCALSALSPSLAAVPAAKPAAPLRPCTRTTPKQGTLAAQQARARRRVRATHKCAEEGALSARAPPTAKLHPCPLLARSTDSSPHCDFLPCGKWPLCSASPR